MARKVKFPLEMKEGVLVRTIEELKENFDINKIIGYYIDGKLVKWLEDRGYQEELDKIIRLDKSDKNLNKKLCEIFEIEFIEDNKVDLEKIEKEKFKIQQLKQHTDDENIIKNIEIIAFNQDELLDLLYKGYKEIYLYGEMFDISLSNENMTYIGINNPKVLVNKEIISNVINKNIKFKNIKFFDENTKEILEDICLFEYKPSVLYSKLIENDKAKTLELFKLISNNIDEIDEFIRKNIKYEAFYNKINSIDYYFNNNNNLENINLSSRKLGKILFEKDDNDKYFNFYVR
ncbi:MAG: hypothetical protein KatS3mg079_311 [Caloramator sp.]|nr:MAG: hypothetical protein KatS3mg079_311 [Caloramator sp.]